MLNDPPPSLLLMKRLMFLMEGGISAPSIILVSCFNEVRGGYCTTSPLTLLFRTEPTRKKDNTTKEVSVLIVTKENRQLTTRLSSFPTTTPTGTQQSTCKNMEENR